VTLADVCDLFERAATSRDTASGEPWPDPLCAEAFHGLAGEVVDLIAPHSEADPAALLIQFLVAFGNAIGRGPFFEVEGDRHATNLFTVMVGETAKARKGTSWSRIRRLFMLADEAWVTSRVESGLSSGEGLIWAVRDPTERQERVREGNETRYETVISDPGVEDKRLLILEEEFASTLRVMGREGNTLPPIIRQAWDDGNLSSLVKNSPCRASGALISIIGHITAHELRQYLDRTEAGNGFANRFLFVCVRRSKLLPEGGGLSDSDLVPVARQIVQALASARRIQTVRRDDQAGVLWHTVYEELSEGRPGLLGAVISRAEAQTMRLAMLYALLDGSSSIAASHLQAALAVWEYCEASARCIFSSALGDPVADRILRALRSTSKGLTRTDISDLFGRNKDQARIDRALSLLATMGVAKCVREESGGRPGERWFAC
jgi:Protein of unknown function (DUF3987)